MKFYNDVKELIGNTPMLRLNHLGLDENIQLFAKLELWNPGGSVKDRVGVSMIEDAEERGLLKPGDTIVEATAGNTGLGVALAALNKGFRVVFVVPDKFSIEKQILMRALGAEIINTPREGGMLGASAKAKELLEAIPNSITLAQFDNMANPKAHYETTGREIYDDLEGQIDYVVAGAGSGGTFSGVLKYLKEKNPKIKGILADPIGSTMGGGTYGSYDIEGIGNDFIAKTMDMSLVDEVIKVSDRNAYAMVKELAKKEGIIAGSSSGAALYASLALAKKIKSGTIVTIFPDRGDRYFSKNIFE